MFLNSDCLTTNNINFGKKQKNIGKRRYTDEERKLRHEINTISLKFEINDIYTGKKLTVNSNPSSVEHIIPFEQRKSPNLPPNFNINGLGNLFPVGIKGNLLRGNEDFKETIQKEPVVLNRLLNELGKIEKINTPIINGKEWSKSLLNTFAFVLNGIYSDVKTRTIGFTKI